MNSVAEAKQIFYNTLERNGVTAETYLGSVQGMRLLKTAAALISKEGLQKKASMLSLLTSVSRFASDPTDPIGRVVGAGAMGTIGGYTSASLLGRLTSPTSTSIGNLQKKELIAEYDTAIEELKHRLEASKLR